MVASVRGKTFLITGASSGIGAALKGLVEHNKGAVVNFSRRAGVDITDSAAVQSALWALPGGRVDVLVNNAATYLDGPFWEHSDGSIQKVLDVGLIAPILLTKYLLNACPRILGEGSVVYNILSNDLRKHPPGFLEYTCAKAGLQEFTYCLAKEVKPLGIRVCGLILGATRTPMLSPSLPSPPLLLDPEEVARFILESIELAKFPADDPWMYLLKRS